MNKNKASRLLNLYLLFAKIGLFTFGGGMSMISLFSSELVTKRKWISDDEMLDITAIAESTPGPIAVNTATYIGYKKEGIIGGIIATLGAITPSIIIISLIALFYDKFMEIETIGKAFDGIIAAVIVLLTFSVLNLSKGLKNKNLIFNLSLILLTVLVRLLFNEFSTILIIICGAIIGTFFNLIKTNKEVNK